MSNDESLSAARLRRGLTIPILATATGVAQHDLKAAEQGDAGALSVSEATRVGVVLGIDAGPGRGGGSPADDDGQPGEASLRV